MQSYFLMQPCYFLLQPCFLMQPCYFLPGLIGADDEGRRSRSLLWCTTRGIGIISLRWFCLRAKVYIVASSASI